MRYKYITLKFLCEILICSCKHCKLIELILDLLFIQILYSSSYFIKNICRKTKKNADKICTHRIKL